MCSQSSGVYRVWTRGNRTVVVGAVSLYANGRVIIRRSSVRGEVGQHVVSVLVLSDKK